VNKASSLLPLQAAAGVAQLKKGWQLQDPLQDQQDRRIKLSLQLLQSLHHGWEMYGSLLSRMLCLLLSQLLVAAVGAGS
jgi:hypothetical protein